MVRKYLDGSWISAYLTRWAMSQFVSDDSGPIISTPSAVTMAISCYIESPKKIYYFLFLETHLQWNVAAEIRIFSWRTNRRKSMPYPVVRAGITVVQNFQASLYQRSCFILCDFYLVLRHLPHQGLQKHKHIWWVHITSVLTKF